MLWNFLNFMSLLPAVLIFSFSLRSFHSSLVAVLHLVTFSKTQAIQSLHTEYSLPKSSCFCSVDFIVGKSRTKCQNWWSKEWKKAKSTRVEEGFLGTRQTCSWWQWFSSYLASFTVSNPSSQLLGIPPLTGTSHKGQSSERQLRSAETLPLLRDETSVCMWVGKLYWNCEPGAVVHWNLYRIYITGLIFICNIWGQFCVMSPQFPLEFGQSNMQSYWRKFGFGHTKGSKINRFIIAKGFFQIWGQCL